MTNKDFTMRRKKADGSYDNYYPETKSHNVIDDDTGQTLKEQYNNIVTKKANLVDNKIPTNELPLASQIEAEAGVSDSTLMTPLKVRQFIVSNGGSGGGVTNVVFQCGKKYWKYTASQATSTIVIPTEQFNSVNDVLEIVDDNNLILLKDINYVISNNTVTLIGYDLIAGESLHFLITQTSYDYNSLMNKPEIVNDYSGGTNKIASAESVKQLFQLASDGKTNVATEINAKGVTATVSETFTSLANKIKTYLTKIEGTAAAGDVLSGKTFKNSTGNLITGSMIDRGTVNQTLTTQGQQFTIPDGKHSGSGKVTASFSNLVPGNIKKGVYVGSVIGALESIDSRYAIFFPVHKNFTATEFRSNFDAYSYISCSKGSISPFRYTVGGSGTYNNYDVRCGTNFQGHVFRSCPSSLVDDYGELIMYLPKVYNMSKVYIKCRAYFSRSDDTTNIIGSIFFRAHTVSNSFLTGDSINVATLPKYNDYNGPEGQTYRGGYRTTPTEYILSVNLGGAAIDYLELYVPVYTTNAAYVPEGIIIYVYDVYFE